MQGKKKHTIITPISFRDRWDELKTVLQGKKREIAERAGCSVKRVDNAISLQIVSHDLLQPILNAMEEIAREELEKIQL